MHIQPFQSAGPVQACIAIPHVLLVIHDHQARYDLADQLLDAGCRLTLAASFNVADMLLEDRSGFDLLIADETLPGFGTNALTRLATLACPGMPMLLLDEGGVRGHGVVGEALRMMRRWPVQHAAKPN